jgi:FKBP-type peptidyl-prolyl cis-trans isomerase
MKQTIFTLLLLSTIGFMSCRKTGTEPNIAQYDQTQIQNYIKANGITGMKQDTVGGDTSGIYYKVILPGSGAPLTYSDNVSFVFTLRSFDGKYTSTDTILNHYAGYVGHISTSNLPAGLEIAIINDLKYSGGSMRILIPSDLAYGVNGYGSGSISVAGSHIAGNQCLDYYVHIISSEKNNVYGTNAYGYQYISNPAQNAYDDQVIQNYIKTSGITYTRTPSINVPGAYYYYAIRVPGTGTDTINQNSTITTTYAGRILNNTYFDESNNTIADTISFAVPTLALGVQEALSHATTGATISMILPSALGYGANPPSGGGIPTYSPLRFEFEVRRVSP